MIDGADAVLGGPDAGDADVASGEADSSTDSSDAVDTGDVSAIEIGGTPTQSSCGGPPVAVPAAERVSNGNPLLPPKWAFGILWGSYYDQVGSPSASGGSLVAAAKRIREEYAGDLMWIDSSWVWHEFGDSANAGQYYVCFQFDPTVFPDPGSMIGQVRDLHFHFGLWQWPWMGHGCQYFSKGQTDRLFVMKGDVPAQVSGGWHGDPHPAQFDFTNPSAVSWWNDLNRPLVEWGLDFLKLDTTEPQQNSPMVSGGGTFADPSKNYEHERNASAYALTKLYAGAHDPNAKLNGARGFIMQKVSSPHNDQLPGWWTDDIDATLAGMQLEMARASTLNSPGTAAYWGGDTGGYHNTPTDEVYVRWLEYSTFTPLQEFFGAKQDSVGARFPWLFGAQAQAIQKKYADLRYRLLPFRYSNALAAYIGRPTAYPVTWIGSTQLLVGSGASQLLVQPVTVAGATTASVKLPASANWIDYFSGRQYQGGTTATVAAPLDREPVFVKAGSIIPMGPALRYVDEVPADPLTLDIYPAGKTRYTLYEDDGVSEGYLGGAFSSTTFTSDDTGTAEAVTIGAQVAKYRFAGQLCSRSYVLRINDQRAAPASVTRDGVAVPASSADSFTNAPEGWYYDPAAHVVWVRFKLASDKATTLNL